jgi:heme-degrading monooxygenase HmoA
MYVILWEFEIEAGHEEQFQSCYSPAGDWARLFSQSPGYLGTELLQSCENPTRYLTIDRWSDQDAYNEFLRTHREAYHALDARCEKLTRAERSLGHFVLPAA